MIDHRKKKSFVLLCEHHGVVALCRVPEILSVIAVNVVHGSKHVV